MTDGRPTRLRVFARHGHDLNHLLRRTGCRCPTSIISLHKLDDGSLQRPFFRPGVALLAVLLPLLPPVLHCISYQPQLPALLTDTRPRCCAQDDLAPRDQPLWLGRLPDDLAQSLGFLLGYLPWFGLATLLGFAPDDRTAFLPPFCLFNSADVY